MDTFQEFHDPRLVALYDVSGGARPDTAFYVDLAARLPASSIVDVGCGTGAITCELARRGYRVTGVDPAPLMLEVARRRPGGDRVRWIAGDASSLDGPPADLAIMSAHVAQVIREERAWENTLAAIHAALRPGGQLAFDSRNPDGQAWLHWTPEASRRRLPGGDYGPVDVWWNLLDVRGELVRYEIHYRFARSGQTLISRNELRFRTRSELTEALDRAGFDVQEVFGGWDRSPVSRTSPELIFVVARR